MFVAPPEEHRFDHAWLQACPKHSLARTAVIGQCHCGPMRPALYFPSGAKTVGSPDHYRLPAHAVRYWSKDQSSKYQQLAAIPDKDF